ncbi:MAG: hypothetical protein ACKVHR_16200 [Pirellulales bacterium]|jgi:hypothetical protein
MPKAPASHSFRPNPNASIEEMLEKINGMTAPVAKPKGAYPIPTYFLISDCLMELHLKPRKIVIPMVIFSF